MERLPRSEIAAGASTATDCGRQERCRHNPAAATPEAASATWPAGADTVTCRQHWVVASDLRPRGSVARKPRELKQSVQGGCDEDVHAGGLESSRFSASCTAWRRLG